MNGISTGRRRFLLPRSRRLTGDVLFFHRRVPLCPHARTMDLAELESLRQNLSRRVSLPAIFIRAYGLMAAECPVLRQLHYRWPLANVYEHDSTVLMMAIAREYQGEPWLFWGRFQEPEHRSLTTLQEQLDRLQSEPVEQVFRQQLQLSRLPMPLRRFLWWWKLNGRGPVRARRTGTAFLSTLASQGTEIVHPPSFQTGCLSYGPFDEHHKLRVTLSYDHRLMDGLTVAKALRRFEQILTDTLTAELRQLGSAQVRPAAWIQPLGTPC